MSDQTTSEALGDTGSDTGDDTGGDPTKAAPELHTEAHDPAVPEAYAAFMRTGWGDRELDLPRQPVAERAAARRDKLAGMFPGERLVLPAGTFKVRSNDTDYKFRPDTAHTYFSGNQTSDAVLVVEDGESVLYARPRSARDTDEFFRDRQYGELWVGRRPSLHELSDSLGIECRHIDTLQDRLTSTNGAKTRVLRGVAADVDRMVAADDAMDADLQRVVGELRLIKDDWEVAQLQEACDITALGFEDSVREWKQVLEYGERWIEGTFQRRARAMGNDVGYDSIVGGGKHATTLHWIDNTGPIEPGKLVLLDMGVEGRNLYTADVTRTLPVDGRFTQLQRDLYDLVHQAQQKGIEATVAGQPFLSAHNAAVQVLAHGLEDLDLLPVSAQEALDPESKVYSRWTLHGVSHMLGMDVHDCAGASPEIYPKGDLEVGMVLTVEPGLYFQEDDLLVPEELRGIGIRIEDDILVTADGPVNLSASLPRTSADVEEWMGRHLP
ncbi:MAG TPA: aminopeptidase P family protein [Nocardioides sp.]|uniref:aminopeptidase P family protein n=1 Tax=Nocardioides sp. TaxID=35761 RepID=UPI002E35AF52|nr:aminopeptidase P family protein [Nocardioides sp.]HEX5087903.1 aminopeptidase P family protein [Nocardioides sp.]